MTEEKTPADGQQPAAPVSPDPQAPAAPAENVQPNDPNNTPPKDGQAAPVTPPEEDEQAVLKKRLSGALSENERKGEELRKALKLQADLVRDNPDYINKIVQEDPIMGNKVIQEVWGHAGIRSYKQLQEFIKLQEMKESNPEVYNTQRELMEVKGKLQAKEEREREKTKKDFLKERGLTGNQYDPAYAKLEEALTLVNPNVIENDYEAALQIAYNIAVGQQAIAATPPQPKPTLGTGAGAGTPPAPMPASSASGGQKSEWSDWLSAAWSERQKS